MKRIHPSRMVLISATITSFMAMPSHAALLSTVQLAAVCQEAPPDPSSSSNIDSKPLKLRDGYTINVLSFKKNHTKSIAVILHNNAAPGQPEAPIIKAVCLDRTQDATSYNGNIAFSGEKGTRVPIVFRLVGFKATKWVQPAEKSLAMAQTDSPNGSAPLVPGQVPPCLVPPAITATAQDLQILMCDNPASYDFYYIYGLYMSQKGNPNPIRIDPQIIHHPS